MTKYLGLMVFIRRWLTLGFTLSITAGAKLLSCLAARKDRQKEKSGRKTRNE